MRRKHKAKDSEAAEMNLTPMIDVTFLLLIFFLLGTKFKEPEGKLNAYLPKDKGPPLTNIAQIDPIEEITIRVKMMPGRTRPVYILGDIHYPSVSALEEKLELLYDPTKPVDKQPVTIDPDPKASYADVVYVLDACLRVGLTDVAFAAPVPEGPQEIGAPRPEY